MKSRRPYVILNAAMSLDGKIATRTGESRLSSREDLRRVHKLRSRVDGIMVGLGTVLIDNPKLTVKHYRGNNPRRIIVDSQARIPTTAHVIKTAREISTIVAVTDRAPSSRIRRLNDTGVVVLRSGRNRLVTLPNLMVRLRRLGVRRLLLEGGGTLNWNMFRDRLVDEVFVSISPKIVGGVGAVSLVGGQGVGKMEDAFGLRFVSARKYGDDLVLNYRVR